MKEKNNIKIIVLAILGAAILLCTAIVITGIIISRRSTQTNDSGQNIANQQINSNLYNDIYGDNEEYDELNNMYMDREILSSITTDIVSCLAQRSGGAMKSTTVELSNFGDIVDSDYSGEVIELFLQLNGYTSMDDFIASLSFKSETANDPNGADGKVFIESKADSEMITIFMTENHDINGSRIEKLTVDSENY